MNRTILTEKPSVAKEMGNAIFLTGNDGQALYSKHFEPGDRLYGWIEGQGYDGHFYRITWLQGHLLELKVRDTDTRWKLEDLPVLPKYEDFELVPKKSITGPGAGGAGQETVVHRLRMIERAFEEADEIIAGTDAGREGQGIFEETYLYLQCDKPVLRLWCSSLTEEEVREALESMRDNDDYASLAKEARMRQIEDWVKGINSTRALTLGSGYNTISPGEKNVLSQGRLQTPLLKKICERYNEHKNFVSEPYWNLVGDVTWNGVTFRYSRGKYTDLAEAQADCTATISGMILTVAKKEPKRNTALPPLLHDIASLQKMANKRYAFPMDKTIEVAQQLYEMKLISYPRTGSRFISEKMFEKVPTILESVFSHPLYGPVAEELAQNPDAMNKRSVNDGKLTDHYGLIITGKTPGELTEDQQLIYDLILMRFLETFCAASVSDTTTMELESGELTFVTKSRVEISPGWKTIERLNKQTLIETVEDVDEEQFNDSLPDLEVGDLLPVGDLHTDENKTSPPPYFTDATLLTAMENAGQDCKDENLKVILKGKGIGTPATRHEALKTLIERGYVERSVKNGKNLIPTELGLMVYPVIKNLNIANVEQTALMELRLTTFSEDDEADEKEMFDQILKEVSSDTAELLESEQLAILREQIDRRKLWCPRCGNEMGLFAKNAYCKGCQLSIFRHVGAKEPNGKDLTDASMRKLITEGDTGLLQGFLSKDGKPYSAHVILDRTEWKAVIVFEKDAKKMTNTVSVTHTAPASFSRPAAPAFEIPRERKILAVKEMLRQSPASEVARRYNTTEDELRKWFTELAYDIMSKGL